MEKIGSFQYRGQAREPLHDGNIKEHLPLLVQMLIEAGENETLNVIRQAIYRIYIPSTWGQDCKPMLLEQGEKIKIYLSAMGHKLEEVDTDY